MQELKTKIIGKIKEENIKPKPKWLFFFKAFGLGLAVAFVFLFAFYILLFVGFMMSERDWVQDSTYSLSGLYFLFNTLPLTMIVVAGVMMVVAAWTAYKYGLSYRKPFIYTFGAIVVVLFIARFVFVFSGLQTYIKEEAFKNGVSLVPDFLKNMRNEVKSAQMK